MESVNDSLNDMTLDELSALLYKVKRQIYHKINQLDIDRENNDLQKFGYFITKSRKPKGTHVGLSTISLYSEDLPTECYNVLKDQIYKNTKPGYGSSMFHIHYTPRVNPNSLYPSLNVRFWTALEDNSTWTWIRNTQTPLYHQGLFIFY